VILRLLLNQQVPHEVSSVKLLKEKALQVFSSVLTCFMRQTGGAKRLRKAGYPGICGLGVTGLGQGEDPTYFLFYAGR
jgi:hypothetical protein